MTILLEKRGGDRLSFPYIYAGTVEKESCIRTTSDGGGFNLSERAMHSDNFSEKRPQVVQKSHAVNKDKKSTRVITCRFY